MTHPSGTALLASTSLGAFKVFLTTFVVALGVPIAPASAQTAVPYCPELKELNNYAMTSQRFAPIIGQPRSGNYNEAKLSLSGWKNCEFYATRTYTCESQELKSQEEAAKAQQRIAQEILNCFDGTWAEAQGPDFIVLHPKLGSVSFTLNLGETDSKIHIVSLIMFLRR